MHGGRSRMARSAVDGGKLHSACGCSVLPLTCHCLLASPVRWLAAAPLPTDTAPLAPTPPHPPRRFLTHTRALSAPAPAFCSRHEPFDSRAPCAATNHSLAAALLAQECIHAAGSRPIIARAA